ncbi:transcription termination/antitermination NusG family protein [Roseiarcaceae bacterium H3SJ34-1]|uniref:transcription termination/antitermination NusG family protein n=1 Tax=Terripilifer ovatus TaxID=3032367 RepID=UPI003AB91AA7|nr:transcription termination/antitermination NusG family protein [Roseiarcaceae bacterium H3SJ34-1]
MQTLPHREAVAEQHLYAQGFRGFLPRFRKTVRHARKLRQVLAPVFPGYMFVIMDVQHDRWRSINGTFGVSKLVTAIDRPVPVPAGIVEALQSSSDLVGLVRFDGGLVTGQKVRVLSGPFAQAIGALERLDDNGRVRVLLDMMGGKVPAVIDRAALTAA